MLAAALNDRLEGERAFGYDFQQSHFQGEVIVLCWDVGGHRVIISCFE
jgi:hypothetical protein